MNLSQCKLRQVWVALNAFKTSKWRSLYWWNQRPILVRGKGEGCSVHSASNHNMETFTYIHPAHCPLTRPGKQFQVFLIFVFVQNWFQKFKITFCFKLRIKYNQYELISTPSRVQTSDLTHWSQKSYTEGKRIQTNIWLAVDWL